MNNIIIFRAILLILTFKSGQCISRAKRYTESDVKFYLFTPENPDTPQILEPGNVSNIKESNFNVEWPIRFIIHGWEANNSSTFSIQTREEYLKKDNFNVIVVDWSIIAMNIYPLAASQIDLVGKTVAVFANFLHTTQNAAFNEMYLIGHSLGAHISGIAGYNVKPNKFNTIFALDPARPLFEFASLENIVDPTDAVYVESIQTDTTFLGVGMINNVGVASFYPNRDMLQQPGCVVPGCSHIRATTFFAESINSEKGFWGQICKSNFFFIDCTGEYVMGGEPSTPKKGEFYLKTNSMSPFARGQESYSKHL